MALTNTNYHDYQRRVVITSRPHRLCTSCGGNVFPAPRTGVLTCASCKGLGWEWVQEADSAEYRASKKLTAPAQLKHTPNDYTAVDENETVEVSKFLGGIAATASKTWAERHLNNGGS